jgi:hypothetical protein
MMSAQIKNRVSEMFAVQRYIAVLHILASQENKYMYSICMTHRTDIYIRLSRFS